MIERLPFIPYPPIERHGVIGDRRTAALVAADGTIDWLCLPDYDGPSVFGTLLDAERGGFWSLGPALPTFGVQRYVDESVVLETVWETAAFALVLTDAMVAPEDERPAGSEGRRTIVRQLRCARGIAPCLSLLRPRREFGPEVTVQAMAGGVTFAAGELCLGLWSSRPSLADGDCAWTTFRLQAGEAVWAVTSLAEMPDTWTEARAEAALAKTRRYWETWNRNLTYTGPRGDWMRRTAQTAHLLSFAPAGSLGVARLSGRRRVVRDPDLLPLMDLMPEVRRVHGREKPVEAGCS